MLQILLYIPACGYLRYFKFVHSITLILNHIFQLHYLKNDILALPWGARKLNACRNSSYTLTGIWKRHIVHVVSLPIMDYSCILLEYAWLTTVLAILGKLFISTTFVIMINWACEIYPTEVRNSCLGASTMAGALGGVAAPYIAQMVSCNFIYRHITHSRLEFHFLSVFCHIWADKAVWAPQLWRELWVSVPYIPQVVS